MLNVYIRFTTGGWFAESEPIARYAGRQAAEDGRSPKNPPWHTIHAAAVYRQSAIAETVN